MSFFEFMNQYWLIVAVLGAMVTALVPSMRVIGVVCLVLNFGLFGYLYWVGSDKQRVAELNASAEQVAQIPAAVAWVITSPKCVVQGVCLTVDQNNVDAGKIIALNPGSDRLFGQRYSVVVTDKGTYHVEGEISSAVAGQAVTLWKARGDLKNVLCIEANCYRLPMAPPSA
ncbi:hypothetical protein [Pseudomonas aeruginosa]|uniref:hypothetical protein n=1 Tax=Pseudomonas aeruginosa TaxID=287 RepID=UPI0032B6101F|nr:hypothetical protein [Pseudomonas aeruginosa]